MKIEKNQISLKKYIEDVLYKKLKEKEPNRKLKIGMDKNLMTHRNFN